jgi:hypothetical protein
MNLLLDLGDDCPGFVFDLDHKSSVKLLVGFQCFLDLVDLALRQQKTCRYDSFASPVLSKRAKRKSMHPIMRLGEQ